MQVSACLLQLLTKNVHLPSGKNRQCDIMKKRKYRAIYTHTKNSQILQTMKISHFTP